MSTTPTRAELAHELQETLDLLRAIIDQSALKGIAHLPDEGAALRMAVHERIVISRTTLDTLAAPSPTGKAKPRVPKIVIDRDPSQLDDSGLRAYYKQNDLYYSALFHADRARHADQWLALAEHILYDGQTQALRREYLALYAVEQREHRGRYVMPSDQLAEPLPVIDGCARDIDRHQLFDPDCPGCSLHRKPFAATVPEPIDETEPIPYDDEGGDSASA